MYHGLDQLANRFLGKPAHTLEPEEISVLKGIKAQRAISRDAADASVMDSSYGERLSDRVSAIGGSWGFIITFSIILLSWMLLNADLLSRFGMAFDPYPFIFLNLMLSTVAAIQAPIIMMSQNRQAKKERLSASLDFEVNLRAEVEIMRLHEKVDTLILERLDAILLKLGESDTLGSSPASGFAAAA